MAKAIQNPVMADEPTFEEKLRRQFSGLDPNDPSMWPVAPRVLLFLVTAIAIAVAGWYFLIQPEDEALVAAQAKEQQLRQSFTKKVTQAVNLDALKKQLEQVQQYVTQLEKQLPGRAEMDALLSDINQAGLGRSLQFELFKPGITVPREYYAELPIQIKMTGDYHDMGLFAGDLANLPRIVTLNDVKIGPENNKAGGRMTLEGVVKTFRYLDPEEVAEQRKIAKDKKGGK
ncbi:type 4a pilus biogenesis protein PilO [Hydrogenophaga sp. 5NK40-0174]|uniref:type 4a pilus biogenesis protein PilO n=1 Tax=Hydrogenophaga sp. 5NK40-0174 TaxID=3127649 RepID=UPI003108BA7E